jgi:threonine synthase
MLGFARHAALSPSRRVVGGTSLLQVRGLAAAATSAQRVLYRSTRGGQSNLTFSEAVLQGLGTDKGLLVPQRIPTFTPKELESWRGLPFDKLANKVSRRHPHAAQRVIATSP